MNRILSTPTSPQGPLELTQGETALHHPAPEREGEIAARESLEPEGHRLSGTVIEPGTVGAHNGLTDRRDGRFRGDSERSQ